MSQFHFPRINFNGQAYINPSTGNNSFFQPIVFYDPILTKALLPPRLYLLEKHLAPGKKISDLTALIPGGAHINRDESGTDYIEILPVDNLLIFKEWATTPLGDHEIDKNYHPLYGFIRGDKSQKSIMGSCPGYWNYYGDMTFRFQDVLVNSVQVFDRRNGIQIFDIQNGKGSTPFDEIIGAELKMEDYYGKDWGVMIDVCPTMALYSQVFCDFLTLEKDGRKLLRGKPCKASLRFLNFSRIINQFTIEAASGSFFCTIAIDDLDNKDQEPLLHFFTQHLSNSVRLKGLFIRYNLFEVIEDQQPNYQINREKSNPARATVAGSIAPWFEGEMKSITMGRQLVPQTKILPGCHLGSVVCQVNSEKSLVSIDMLGSIPEVREKRSTGSNFSYKTYDLGKLRLKLIDEKGRQYIIGEITISDKDYGRGIFLRSGGMIDFSLRDHAEIDPLRLETGRLILEGMSRKSVGDHGFKAVLLSEEPYMIASDQAGLYAEAGDDPEEGYRSYSEKKEPCRLRIFEKGQPLKESIPIQVIEYRINVEGMQIQKIDLFSHDGEGIKDNQLLLLPTNEAKNSIYFFTKALSFRSIENMQQEITRSGAFINFRVLPSPDFGRYLDPSHSEYPATLSFQTLYEEIFQMYDLIYPISSTISPFNEKAFRKAAPILKKLMHPGNWNSSTYMPSSRELSSMQYALFDKWLIQEAKEE